MKNIATMQDFRDLVAGTLGQFAREHDIEGIAEHLLQISQHDGAHYYGRILDQGTDDLVMVDDFWTLARRYHHATVRRRDPSAAGPFYEPERDGADALVSVSGDSPTPPDPPRTRA